MTKRCPNCGEDKDRDAFYRSSSTLDGLQSWCKKCKHAQGRTPEGRAAKARYKKSGKGKITEARYKSGPTGRAAAKRYYHGPSGTIARYLRRASGHALAVYRRWVQTKSGRESVRRASHSDAARVARKRYYESAQGRAKHRELSARRRNAPGELSAEEWATVVGMYTDHRGTMCAYCYEIIEKPTIEHIEPISQGGGHSFYNVVPTCQSCNSSKGAKPLLQWMYDKEIGLHLQL